MHRPVRKPRAKDIMARCGQLNLRPTAKRQSRQADARLTRGNVTLSFMKKMMQRPDLGAGCLICASHCGALTVEHDLGSLDIKQEIKVQSFARIFCFIDNTSGAILRWTIII